MVWLTPTAARCSAFVWRVGVLQDTSEVGLGSYGKKRWLLTKVSRTQNTGLTLLMHAQPKP